MLLIALAFDNIEVKLKHTQGEILNIKVLYQVSVIYFSVCNLHNNTDHYF